MGFSDMHSSRLIFLAFAVIFLIQTVLSGGVIWREASDATREHDVGTLHSGSFESCPVEVSKVYDEPETAGALDNDEWCKDKANTYRIRIGKTWGSAPKEVHHQWNKRGCNDLILNGGKPRTCSEKSGWKYFDDWLATRKPRLALGSYSQLNCGKDAKLSMVCAFQNVMVDFGKSHIIGASRRFDEGFVRAYGRLLEPMNMADVMVPGLVVDETPMFSSTFVSNACDEYESRPTFIMSHDDTDNLAHHMNDVTMVWAMGVLSGRRLSESLFIHMDGIRKSGPAGGNHRLMHVATPDSPSTFNDYYVSWFEQIKKGIDYKKKRICFKEIYFQPMPGLAWVWDGWSEVKPCANKTHIHGLKSADLALSRPIPSPLFQSFNWHIRQSWGQKFGVLAPPATDTFHILLISRRASGKKGSAGRVVANNDDVADALRALDLSSSTSSVARGLKVRVTTLDLATLTFREQVALVHSAHLLVGMHGAGINQFFNMAIGERYCCGLVEMFPDRSMGFDAIFGNMNMAKSLGMSYARYQVVSAGPQAAASVNVQEMVEIVQSMIAVLTDGSERICLNDVKDSANSIVYTKNNLHTLK